MHRGFIFDRFDVTGVILLYNGPVIVASKAVEEYRITFGLPREFAVHPVGRTYTHVVFNLIISDNDTSTTYSLTVYHP